MKELQLIQSALKAPKGQKNSFGNYKYRSCEDILEAVKPLLSEHNCDLVISDCIELVGNRYYVKATATISKDGELMSTTAFAREPENKKGMDESQITGAASSYARKYALNGLFCIDDTKDADTMKPPEKATASAPDATGLTPKRSELVKKLTQLAEKKDMQGIVGSREKFIKAFGENSLTLWSGNPQNKTETYGMVYKVFLDRVEGKQPLNANQTPEEIQKMWSDLASTCSDYLTVDLLENQINLNRCLDTEENWAVLEDLHKQFD
jgi:hypothetical protein